MIGKAWEAKGWWQTLQPDPERVRPADRVGDRAALARLRRCATIAAAMQEVATIVLFQRVAAGGPNDLPEVALAAAVLAHVRIDVPGRVARVVGPSSVSAPETAILKPLRLRRLMEAVGPDDRLVAFRRLVALSSGVLPVLDLALSLLNWSEQRRRNWLYDYWNAGRPADDARPDDAIPVAPLP